MASAKSVLDTLRPRAETTLDGLLGQPYDVLLTLPPANEVVIPDVSKKASLTTYRDILPDGRLQVVVQLVVRGMLGSARIWARGFSLRSGEAPVRATDAQLYEFF
jgi:hypothetical protein